MGNSEVTGIGIASVTHQTIMSAAMASTFHASGVSASGCGQQQHQDHQGGACPQADFFQDIHNAVKVHFSQISN
jgi:hypothetical protein